MPLLTLTTQIRQEYVLNRNNLIHPNKCLVHCVSTHQHTLNISIPFDRFFFFF